MGASLHSKIHPLFMKYSNGTVRRERGGVTAKGRPVLRLHLPNVWEVESGTEVALFPGHFLRGRKNGLVLGMSLLCFFSLLLTVMLSSNSHEFTNDDEAHYAPVFIIEIY